MTLSYQTYLEDYIEPSLRHYVRSASGKRGKWRSVGISVLVAVIMAPIILRESNRKGRAEPRGKASKNPGW